MKTVKSLTAAVLIGTAGLSMAQPMQMPMPTKASVSAEAASFIDGEVRKLDLENGIVVLRHGDIPNLAMPAMTMGFDVADKKMLNGFKVGDKVQFQAEIVKGKATVTKLKSVK